ncbi:hypothetical protein BN1088_530006 [Sphingobacterium sp. PM2-P1-29]|nr:hypothetical protein BN1088_530006 [Sphingobacterium sp. PM2-P1-29]
MTLQPYKLSFITVNYNGLEDTRAFLARIDSITFSFSSEVIVIDNGSRQDEYALLKDEFPFITGCYSSANLGFAGGNNIGIRMAQGEFLYFLNNDTLLPLEADSQIMQMLSFFEQHPEAGGITPKIRYMDPPDMIQFAGCTPLTAITLRNKQIGYQEMELGQYEQNSEIPYLHGAAMLIPRHVVQHIGLMPEDFFYIMKNLTGAIGSIGIIPYFTMRELWFIIKKVPLRELIRLLKPTTLHAIGYYLLIAIGLD